MKKLTKLRISNMAWCIARTCKEKGYEDVRIYFNNHAIDVTNQAGYFTLKVHNNMDPHTYFKYAAYHHILSMSFEGKLYEEINCYNTPVWLLNIFHQHGVYFERGDSWNLTCYPVNDELEVEYTEYEKPQDPIYLWDSKQPEAAPFKELMDDWRELSRAYGDKGSCVMGAGFKFKYKGTPYFMAAQSPWQGCSSWESSVDYIKQKLMLMGCTDIRYNYGTMD